MIPVVVGSSPISHPNASTHQRINASTHQQLSAIAACPVRNAGRAWEIRARWSFVQCLGLRCATAAFQADGGHRSRVHGIRPAPRDGRTALTPLPSAFIAFKSSGMPQPVSGGFDSIVQSLASQDRLHALVNSLRAPCLAWPTRTGGDSRVDVQESMHEPPASSHAVPSACAQTRITLRLGRAREGPEQRDPAGVGPVLHVGGPERPGSLLDVDVANDGV